MQLRYDEDFLEAAVFLCANGRRKGLPSLQVSRFHREREKLYSILDPDERNAAFFHLHLEWFREWGLEKILANLLGEFPGLAGALAVLAFRKARGKSDEGAELYVNSGAGILPAIGSAGEAPAPLGVRNGVVALRPERFEPDAGLAGFLRHELTHLHDMVDPSFGYSPALGLPGQPPSQQRLIRERYRLLWDITIDARLLNTRRSTAATREQRGSEFDRAYSFLPEARRQATFEALWNNPSPSHQELLDLAADPRDLHSVRGPLPGGSCPLCSFPTFHWADPVSLGPQLVQSITAEFPAWTPEQGVCQRCVEVYKVARHPLPATVMV